MNSGSSSSNFAAARDGPLPRNDRIAPITPRTAAMTARPSRIGPTTAPCTSDIVVVGPLRRAGEQPVDALDLHGGEARRLLQVVGHAGQPLGQRPDLALDLRREHLDPPGQPQHDDEEPDLDDGHRQRGDGDQPEEHGVHACSFSRAA